MSTSKHIDKICCLILAVTLLLTLLFVNADRLGVQAVSTSVSAVKYTSRIFDPARVHTIDIVMDDWDSFIENCTDEEYAACSVVIDGETYRNVAIRAKGNTSLSSVKEYGNNRYSFKIEFDHYDDALNYYGLDKLCLNNIIQDNTYMKDYLTYRLMYEFGVDAPLCSYTYITVNGEDWGLYLAVEGIEEAFLQRNYGRDYGQLYKPDSMKFGGAAEMGEILIWTHLIRRTLILRIPAPKNPILEILNLIILILGTLTSKILTLRILISSALTLRTLISRVLTLRTLTPRFLISIALTSKTLKLKKLHPATRNRRKKKQAVPSKMQ